MERRELSSRQRRRTGVLTRALLRSCRHARITATDLNQPMLDAGATRTSDDSRLSWQPADAVDLPFEDEAFDSVVCQFGVMFFPDRVRGYTEARRVLKPGGSFAFNVWDRIENNDVPYVITAALVEAMPDEPLVFLSRTPYGYFNPALIRTELESAGMPEVSITPVDATSRTTAAIAFCQGTPLRAEIESHDKVSVQEATKIAEAALLRHFGPGEINAPIRSSEFVARPHGL